MKKPSLSLHHVERLSSDPQVMHFARLINSSFLRTGLTELKELDSEHEAVYLLDVATGKIVSIIVFSRFEKDTYYIPVVWTSKKLRANGLYRKLINWMVIYCKSKGATGIETDVHHDNHKMIKLMERHWRKSFVRFSLPLKGA